MSGERGTQNITTLINDANNGRVRPDIANWAADDWAAHLAKLRAVRDAEEPTGTSYAQ